MTKHHKNEYTKADRDRVKQKGYMQLGACSLLAMFLQTQSNSKANIKQFLMYTAFSTIVINSFYFIIANTYQETREVRPYLNFESACNKLKLSTV